MTAPARRRGDRQGEDDVAEARLEAVDPLFFKNLREHVHGLLRGAIVAGRFRPDERLNERGIAAELGVSTTPVKEALRRLEAEGLVTTQPRRGIYVAFGEEQAEEMTLARAAIESTLARLAAQRIDDQAIAELAGCMKMMAEATAAGDVRLLIALNTQFHQGIHAASRCVYLVRLLAAQRIYDQLARQALLSDEAERAHALAEHGAVFAAVSRRDEDAAEQAMRAHVLRSGRAHIAMAFHKTPVAAAPDAAAALAGPEIRMGEPANGN